MDWDDIYTISKREKLFSLTLEAYERFMAQLPKLDDEIQIAGIYGEKCNKLVLKGDRLLEKYWSYDSSQYEYRPIEMDRNVISYYRLAPKHFDEARKFVEAKRQERERKERLRKERHHAYQELRSLCASPVAKEIIRPIPFGSGTLFLTQDGLVEKTTTGTRAITESEFLDAIEKYEL